jgi:hypothetical protein
VAASGPTSYSRRKTSACTAPSGSFYGCGSHSMRNQTRSVTGSRPRGRQGVTDNRTRDAHRRCLKQTCAPCDPLATLDRKQTCATCALRRGNVICGRLATLVMMAICAAHGMHRTLAAEGINQSMPTCATWAMLAKCRTMVACASTAFQRTNVRQESTLKRACGFRRMRTVIPIDCGQRSGDRGQRLPSTASRAKVRRGKGGRPRARRQA